MKKYLTLVAVAVGLVLGLATSSPNAAANTGGARLSPPGKSCGFDSDCPYGKCKGGQCGGCGFDSDCKGWGKCKNGMCGSCGFDSDCSSFGGCKSGSCAKSPY